LKLQEDIVLPSSEHIRQDLPCAGRIGLRDGLEYSTSTPVRHLPVLLIIHQKIFM
jgi:hypothetical protein